MKAASWSGVALGEKRSLSLRERKEHMSYQWYPQKIGAGDMDGTYSKQTVDFVRDTYGTNTNITIGEFGIWRGATTFRLAQLLDGRGTIHIFDYADNTHAVKMELARRGFKNIVAWGSSYKFLDSYNWNLKKILENSSKPLFDFCYLDGAHTWAIDALTFFLCDRLLKVGGYIQFDDYRWRLRGSSLDPVNVSQTAQMYTDEQIDAFQVRAIVDLLVKRDPHYKEVLRNRIYQKVASAGMKPWTGRAVARLAGIAGRGRIRRATRSVAAPRAQRALAIA